MPQTRLKFEDCDQNALGAAALTALPSIRHVKGEKTKNGNRSRCSPFTAHSAQGKQNRHRTHITARSPFVTARAAWSDTALKVLSVPRGFQIPPGTISKMKQWLQRVYIE
ncbi:hypothetical protein BaRGS_00009366 [Batillaria attramentaria]|uniref:Uncharacterized protein n=1 Tax=Batillaria attramentaria TaxID=370345 RepID=A0ABD0LIR3_9CAEN